MKILSILAALQSGDNSTAGEEMMFINANIAVYFAEDFCMNVEGQ